MCLNFFPSPNYFHSMYLSLHSPWYSLMPQCFAMITIWVSEAISKKVVWWYFWVILHGLWVILAEKTVVERKEDDFQPWEERKACNGAWESWLSPTNWSSTPWGRRRNKDFDAATLQLTHGEFFMEKTAGFFFALTFWSLEKLGRCYRLAWNVRSKIAKGLWWSLSLPSSPTSHGIDFLKVCCPPFSI